MMKDEMVINALNENMNLILVSLVDRDKEVMQILWDNYSLKTKLTVYEYIYSTPPKTDKVLNHFITRVKKLPEAAPYTKERVELFANLLLAAWSHAVDVDMRIDYVHYKE